MDLENYIIEHDGVCWTLSTGRRKRKGRETAELLNPSYHGTLQQVAKHLVELKVTGCIEFNVTVNALHRVMQHLLNELIEQRDPHSSKPSSATG